MADEEGEGVGLPQKGLNMIIKDALPDMRIANETRELLNQCCVEFIKHVSREAQMISSKDQRKTIYHDHVQKALKNLGFPREYVDAANSVLGECKMAAEKRLKRKNSRLDKCGIPEEQLWQMQQQLIEQARKEEADKQQAAIAQFGGYEQFALFQQQMAAAILPQAQASRFTAAAPPSSILTSPPTSSLESSSSAFPIPPQMPTNNNNNSSATLSQPAPEMLMPFGLTPQQLVVPAQNEESSSAFTSGQQQQSSSSFSSSFSMLTDLTPAQVLMLTQGRRRADEDNDEENYDI